MWKLERLRFSALKLYGGVYVLFLNQSTTIYISEQMTSKHIKHLDMSEAIKLRSDQFHAN